MILAAAECARNPKAQPPPELRLAWQAVSYHTLPEAGGLLDQPAGLLSRMTSLYNVWTSYRAYDRRNLNKAKEWIDANPDLYETVIRVNRMRASMEKNHAEL